MELSEIGRLLHRHTHTPCINIRTCECFLNSFAPLTFHFHSQSSVSHAFLFLLNSILCFIQVSLVWSLVCWSLVFFISSQTLNPILTLIFVIFAACLPLCELLMLICCFVYIAVLCLFFIFVSFSTL